MGIGFFRVGKLAMATVGTIWTILNVESLYSQTKHLFLPSSYPFLFFNVVLLTILFQCSSLASKFNHLLLKLVQSTTNNNSGRNSVPPPVQEGELPRSFSDIWHRVIMGIEHSKEDFETIDESGSYVAQGEKEEGCSSGEADVEEDDEGRESMEETWKAIMEGKKQAEERELKKSNTWAVTPTIDQLKGKPTGDQLDSSKSLAVVEESGGGGRCGRWRRMEVVLTREELNQRADEFITKIKHNIRLERLESYNLFLRLINRRGD